MPIVHRFESDFYRLAVWSSVEPESELYNGLELSSSDQNFIESVKSPTRRREILTVRRLLQALAGANEQLSYNASGKPELEGGGHVSISHSKEMIAMIISEKHPVGIDIEAKRPKIERIAERFLSKNEISVWGDQLNQTDLHLIWGAKEVLFKLYSKGGVDFKNDMFIDPPPTSEATSLSAHFSKTDMRFDVDIHFKNLDGFLMTWAVKC